MQTLPSLRLSNEQIIERLAVALKALTVQMEELEERILVLCQEHLNDLQTCTVTVPATCLEDLPDLTMDALPDWDEKRREEVQARIDETDEVVAKLEVIKQQQIDVMTEMLMIVPNTMEN